MALLRNLRGIFTEIDDRDICVKVLEELKAEQKKLEEEGKITYTEAEANPSEICL